MLQETLEKAYFTFKVNKMPLNKEVFHIVEPPIRAP